MTCKSPAHKQYADALEGFYIQAALAQRDLEKRLDEARADANRLGKQPWETFRPHMIDEAESRLVFAREQLVDAEVAINRHFTRGCRNVPAEAPSNV